MKLSICKLTLMTAAALGAFTVDGALNTAQAGTTIINHPAVCKPLLNNQTGTAPTALAAWEIGTLVHNKGTGYMQVICPLARANGQGATVYVEGVSGDGVQGQGVYCTAYSLHYDGQLLASKSFAVSNPLQRARTKFDKALAFSATEAPTWAALSVICTLPTKGVDTITGLSVYSN